MTQRNKQQEACRYLDAIYEKFSDLEFATPLSMDTFCWVCGRFLTFSYADHDQTHNCRFCPKCWEMAKRQPAFECRNPDHLPLKLSKDTMVKISNTETDVLIICPYKCRGLYTVDKLLDHCTKCKYKPIDSTEKGNKTGEQEEPWYRQSQSNSTYALPKIPANQSSAIMAKPKSVNQSQGPQETSSNVYQQRTESAPPVAKDYPDT